MIRCLNMARSDVYLKGESMITLAGFIKLHRKLAAWGWYTDDIVKSIFLHLLLTANYKETAWKDITLKPGQLVTSVRKLSEELRHTERQTRTALDKLKSTNEIAVKTTNKFSIITVVNWEEYQSLDDITDKQNDKQNVTPTTNKTVKSDTQNDNSVRNIRNNKECKEYNIYIVEIIDYLNKSAGTNYRASSRNTVLHIQARLNEGYKVEDFKKVIDVKCSEWLKDEKMKKYLRPET